MVGQRHDDGIFIRFLESFIQHPIGFHVYIQDGILEFGRQSLIIDGIGGIHMPPEYVLALVGAGNIKKEQPGFKILQFMLEHSLAFLQDKSILVKVFMVVENIVVQGLKVSRKPFGIEGAEFFLKLFAVAGRSGDGEGGVGRIDIQGGDVEFEVGTHLLQIKVADGADTLCGDQIEIESLPVTPFSLL